jgi:hypothetical protein
MSCIKITLSGCSNSCKIVRSAVILLLPLLNTKHSRKMLEHPDREILIQLIHLDSRKISQQPENCENRNDPDLVQDHTIWMF